MLCPLSHIDGNGLRTILVPTDFSEPSNIALQIALDLAIQQNARVYLLHVVPFRQVTNPEGMMRKQLALFPEAKSVEIIQEMRKGNIHKEILKTETERNVDLIIMARHGRSSPLYTFFHGVTRKVKKKARCSVLVVGA